MSRSKVSDIERQRGAALGKSLQKARQKAKKTAEGVAVDAHLSVDTLRRIEQGRIVNPGVFTVAAIAKVLDVGVDALMTASRRRPKR